MREDGGVRAMLVVLVWLMLGLTPAQSQAALPPCDQRDTAVDPPWVNSRLWCLEQVIHDAQAGELAFTALAAAPDGRLYAARPLAGEVWALTDSDGDGLPDMPRLIADGLTLPNGLAYADGALYVSGGSHIYRIAGEGVETLVDDLPGGAGFWTGGLTVTPGGRIVVAVGAPCDYCLPDDPLRGTILSFALDGSDRQVLARGLRQPGDVAVLNGTVWTLDTARDALADTADLDELNRVEPGAHFGWPTCIGADNRRDWPDDVFDCGGATAPALTFPTHSTPLGLAAYTSATFPNLTNTLLVTLSGSSSRADLAGYTLAAVRFDARGEPVGYEVLIPEQTDKNNPPGLTLNDIHYQGSGFWPHRPIDVAVSAEGWVYVSMGGGRILALRPAD